MICPHCHHNLKQKERYGRTCTRCKRKFALDPKENSLLLHDVRVRKLADRLSENGRYRYTAAQLHHAAARKAVTATRPKLVGRLGLSVLVGALAYFAVQEELPLPAALAVGVLVLAGAGTLAVYLYRRAKRRPLVLPMAPQQFGGTVLGGYRNVYGSNPPGLIDRVPPPEYDLDACAAAVVADEMTLACLRANGLADALGLALVPVERWLGSAYGELAVRPRLPVLLLHDASPAGVEFAARTVHDLGAERVVDVGLRPRTVMKRAPLTLRTPPVEATLAKIRARGGLAAEEMAWLAAGNWVPLAAIRPAPLITAVRRAADRAVSSTDPERRKAKAVGFLSWPEG